MGGTLAADHVVLNSAHTLQMMTESFSYFLNPEAMLEVLEKSEVIPFGLVNEELFEQPIREHDKPVVLYNHRFENYKQPKVTAEVLNALRRNGLDFEVWVTQYASQKVGEFPVDAVVGHPEFGQYIENIAVPAVNTINSIHETFCISILDSLALGQLVVAPNAVTFPELVPDDYPFLFSDKANQVEMLAHILGTWPDEYHRWSQKLRDHARKTFSVERYCEAYLQLLAEQGAKWEVSERRPHVKRKMENFFNSIKPGEYPLHKFGNKMREKLNLQHQSCPNRRVIRETTRAGAELGWNGQEVTLRWKP
jgi:glycosyltransferase involved in cell wall biosynthesis